MSEKWSLSHTNQEKSGQSIYFLLKKKVGGGRALIIYQAALKKGAIWHAYPYYAIYIKTSCKLSYNIFHSFNPILLVKNDFVSI